MNKRQKIVIVANSTWNIHNFRRNILNILLNNGFEVVVIAPLDTFIMYLNDFPTVHHIPLKHLARKSLNPFHDLRLFFELKKILRRENPNIVLNYTVKPNIWGGLAAAWLNIPYVCAVTGLGYAFLHNGLVNIISQKLYKLSFKFSQKVIFENIDDRLLFNQLGIVEAEKSLSVKGCGINTLHFQPKEPKSIHLDKVIFCFIGRFLYDKGICEFVEAAHIVKKLQPNSEFWLVGEIDYGNPSAINENELQAWIDEKIIIYKGMVADVRPLIREADCVVLPSYREAIPRVIQEAMAMQRCVISTDVAGCREAVEHGANGYLVEVRNAQSLADAMIKIIQLSPKERRAMALKSRKKVETEFDERIIAQQFLEVIQAILEPQKVFSNLLSYLPPKLPERVSP